MPTIPAINIPVLNVSVTLRTTRGHKPKELEPQLRQTENLVRLFHRSPGIDICIGFALWKDGDVLDAIFTAAREGTVITALLCGWLVARWSHLTDRLERWMKEGR